MLCAGYPNERLVMERLVMSSAVCLFRQFARGWRWGGPAAGLLLLLAGVIAPYASQAEDNPALPGFRAAASDPRAIEIADEVMQALGGRQAWDNTRYVSWRFFDRRNHWWDKWTGDVRIESEHKLILMNINTHKGRVWIDGVEATADTLVEQGLELGYGWWVNDAYWVFMPWKLKDSGVALQYLGEQLMTDDKLADVLQLTFEDVGLTPANKYDVYVDKQTRLVMEWSYYEKSTDEVPRFTIPWANWSKIGDIMMVGDHGREKDWKMAVHETLARSVFESPDVVEMSPSGTPAH